MEMSDHGVEQRQQKALDEVMALAAGTRRWTMSVPVNVDSDSDMVLTAALGDITKLLVQLTEARERERVLEEALRVAHHSLVTLHGLIAADAVAPEETFTIDEAAVLRQIDAALREVGALKESHEPTE